MSSIRYCSICFGNQQLNYMHVASHVHISNMKKLPDQFWLMTDDEIHVHLAQRGAKRVNDDAFCKKAR